MTTKRQPSPYYTGSLMVIFLIYFYTIGSYFFKAPLHWTHNRALGYALSILLFVGGIIIFQQIFDRMYPKVIARRITQHRTGVPVVLKVSAFIFDLILSLFASMILVLDLFGHKSGTGISVSGWADGLPFLLVFLYLFLMDKYAGGTIGKRVFGIRAGK